MSSSARAFWFAPIRIFAKVLMVVISLVVILVLFAALFGSLGDVSEVSTDPLHAQYRYIAGERNSENKLLLVNVEGVILGSPPEGFAPTFSFMDFSVSYGYGIREQLEKAAEEDSIKGVFLRLQTPGGTIFGARAIFDGIKAYQSKTGKPVFAYIEGISASGGVMAMVAADKIYADYGSMVGSVGVLGPTLTYFDRPTAFEGGISGGGIVTEGGIEQTMVTAGRHKDLGNPFRRPTAEEIAVLQADIDEEYEAFVQHVSAARDIKPEVLRDDMGAHIFGNTGAERYGLIDGTLSKNDALAALVEQAGLKADDYKLVEARSESSSLLGELFGVEQPQSRSQSTPPRMMQQVCAAVRSPLVYYGDTSQLCQ